MAVQRFRRNVITWLCATRDHQWVSGHGLATLTLSSSRLKPLPARTFVWYLTVGHLTTGRRGPDAGRGAMRRALACRALRLRREKPSGNHCPPSRSGPDARRTGKDRTGRDGTGALAPGRSPTDLASRLVKPRGHAPLPVLVKVGLQDHAIPARRHGCGRKAWGAGNTGSELGAGAESRRRAHRARAKARRRRRQVDPGDGGWSQMGSDNIDGTELLYTHLLRGLTAGKGGSAPEHPGMVVILANQKRQSVVTNQSQGHRVTSMLSRQSSRRGEIWLRVARVLVVHAARTAAVCVWRISGLPAC